jgi:sulfide:quinone oxidoreductase
MRSARRVVVLGGGFAGLETAFLLKHRLRDGVDVHLVTDQPNFLFRPNTIYIPFGGDPDQLLVSLREPAHRQHIALIEGTVEGVEPTARLVHLRQHPPLAYDDLVIATGAAVHPAEIPGLEVHAHSMWTPADMLRLRRELDRIVERAELGKPVRLLFLIPPNNKCAAPLYELVFMTDSWLRRHNLRSLVSITLATAESSYVQVFGPRLHEVVTGEFLDRSITGYREWTVQEIRPHQAVFSNGESLGFDSLVAFPPQVAAVSYRELPLDDRGFIRTEFGSRRVDGVPGIYAPGDAGDFPVKQAFLAFLQADAAAEAITASVQGTEPRMVFDPITMCVMEQFDKAMFAQVPLRLTGDPLRPVEVRPDAGEDYKVGVSPLWRLGKKLLGVYLPMRFRAGEPFHAGAAWKMMESGLRGISGILAD